MTEKDWLLSNDPASMLTWVRHRGPILVESRPTLPPSRLRGYFVTCCRRLEFLLCPRGRDILDDLGTWHEATKSVESGTLRELPGGIEERLRILSNEWSQRSERGQRLGVLMAHEDHARWLAVLFLSHLGEILRQTVPDTNTILYAMGYALDHYHGHEPQSGKKVLMSMEWAADILRDCLPLHLTATPLDHRCRTKEVLRLAEAAREAQLPPCPCRYAGRYDEDCRRCQGTGRSGAIDPENLLVLSDCLEESGCDDPVLLGHLRGVCERCSGAGAIPFERPIGVETEHRICCPTCSGGGVDGRTHTRECWALERILGGPS